MQWLDFDGDGDQDLQVGNDFGRWVQPNRLYRNDGPAPGGGWTFTEVSAALGADQGLYCMGLTAADVDRDLDLDVYMSNLGPNVFLRNDGVFGFADITSLTGTALGDDPFAPHLLATSWSVGFHDFDRDGWIDLYVSNGHIPAAPFLANGTGTPNSIFRHTGPSLGYEDLSAVANVQHPGQGRGAAFADLDRDGDLDIIQFQIDGPPVLLRNDTANGNAYAMLELEGTLSNRDAIGTRLVAEAAGVSHLRYVQPHHGFESSSTKRVHFGLGSAAEIERLTATWPSGQTCRLHRVPVRAHLRWREPSVFVDPLASTAPTSVGPGSTLVLDMVLRNVTAVPVTVQTVKAISVAGGELIYDDLPEVTTVPPMGTRTRRWSVVLPPAIPGTSPIPVQVLWSVVGPDLGLDQWEAVFDVLP